MSDAVPALKSVRFDAATHTYFDDDGKPVPSVTQVLNRSGLFTEMALYASVPQETREAALKLGTAVHWLLELSDQKALPKRIDPALRGYRKAWRTWKKASGFVITGIERQFISSLGYAGTADRIGYFKPLAKLPVVLDFKTGTSIPKYVSIQLAAYARGLLPNGWYARRIAFQPYADGTYSLKEYPIPSLSVDFAKFTEALRKMKENNDNGSK